MSDIASFWSARYHPSRVLLLVKGLYLLLSADLLFEMIEHGGRYGEGGFNVAHFVWIDWLFPLPTPSLYVGMLIACALLSLQLLIGPAPRWLRLVLAAVYTLSWMVSLHDAYQHHYLLSWLLVWCAACPEQRASSELTEPSAPLVQGWGLPMTAITCAIVYAFTGISKCEQDWRTGHVLRVLTHSRAPGDPAPGKFDAARDLLLQVGLDDAGVWRTFAVGTIALQWLIACAYLAAPRRDERNSRLRTGMVSAGLLGSFCFHATAELFHVFEIGLFSYYMLWIATVLLAPTIALRPLTMLLVMVAAPVQKLRAASVRWAAQHVHRVIVGPVLAVTLLAIAGWNIPLPGARAAMLCVAFITIARCALSWRTSSGASELAFSTALSALTTWLVLTQTSVPFDYYRRTAGELRRMGQPERALELYRMGERHAPRGNSRAHTIRELERELGPSRQE